MSLFDLQTPPNPLDKILDPPQNQDYVIKRNQQLYEFVVALQDFSAGGDPKTRFDFPNAKKLNPQVISELVIVEDLMNWWTAGYMIVDSNLEGFELAPSDGGGGDALPPPHTFRMDCRDMLILSIMPIASQTQKGNDLDNPFPIASWMLRGEYFIYDIEDVPMGNVVVKAKKVYFRDIRYQLMSEQRLAFSTNVDLPAADPSGRIDNEVPTGVALSALLMKCNSDTGFGWGSLMNISKTWEEGQSKIFFTAPANYTVLDSVNYILDRHVAGTPSTSTSPTEPLPAAPGRIIFGGADYWDFSGPNDTGPVLLKWDGSKYTGAPADAYGTGVSPPSQATVNAAIARATAGFGKGPEAPPAPSGSGSGSVPTDLCLFETDRFTQDFELIPFSTLFGLSTEGGQPGKFQIEHFFIPTVAQSDSDPNFGKIAGAVAGALGGPTGSVGGVLDAIGKESLGLWKAPMKEENDFLTDTKLPNYGYIVHYCFVDMAGSDNVHGLTTRPVFSYDFKNHQFYCEYEQHDISKTKEYFTTNYVNKMYGGMSGKPAPIFTVNDMRKARKNLDPVFSTKPTKESRLNDGRNQELFASIFLNEHIAFSTLGSTNRTAGKFIGIDKTPITATDNKFDYRLLGQWLVKSVKHIFTRDTYMNEIEAVKIQSFRDLQINEAVP